MSKVVEKNEETLSQVTHIARENLQKRQQANLTTAGSLMNSLNGSFKADHGKRRMYESVMRKQPDGLEE